MVQSHGAQRTLLICMHRWERPRMRRRRLHVYSTDPRRRRETSGSRTDWIPPTRPPWRRRQYRELKKLIFSAPSTCPIDLFGPLANRTVLERLHAAFRVLLASVLPLEKKTTAGRSYACSHLGAISAIASFRYKLRATGVLRIGKICEPTSPRRADPARSAKS